MRKNYQNTYLFSVDVEDDRPKNNAENSFSGRVPQNIEKYLDFFAKYEGSKCTFFVLGNIARKYPDLLRKIEDHGHEIACHSDQHLAVTDMSPEEFKEDLEKNISAIKDAGIAEVKGYRAPFFSLTKKSDWAYSILSDLGIHYSSSVLPAKNPHFGWKGFSNVPIQQGGGVWEIPLTLCHYPFVNIPFGGGVYFRTLPKFLLKPMFKKSFKSGKPVMGYFHPYDIDEGQRKDAFPEFKNKAFFRYLMYKNRHTVFKKLDMVMKTGAQIRRYDDFIEHLKQQED